MDEGLNELSGGEHVAWEMFDSGRKYPQTKPSNRNDRSYTHNNKDTNSNQQATERTRHTIIHSIIHSFNHSVFVQYIEKIKQNTGDEGNR